MPIIQVPQVTSRIIATVDFLAKFTDDEAVAIDLASIGDTTDAALTRRYTRFMTSTQQVDPDSSVVRDGMAGIVSQGLLTQERSDAILG